MIVNSTYFKKEFDISKAQLIGQGNFAQVYRVYDSEIDDYLAIRKVTKNAVEVEDIAKQKIINEQLKRVENQNILKIFDIIDSEHNIWYITQYCEGGSLWDALNDCLENKMNERDALECVYQISRGVQELHNHRITHRDLKPENILLKTRYISGKPIPIIKIADFGLSTKKIIMQTIAGTKQYIAPEQARFHNYTNAVDVWSLGIIFDEILHGTPFFIGENNKEVFHKILKTPYKIRDPSIRESIKDFLLMILKKKPYERPIIAVICQNIQKILDEIDSETGGTYPKNDHRREMKKVKTLNPSQSKNSLQSNAKLSQEKPVETKYERKVTGAKIQVDRKTRTPIKPTLKKQQIKDQAKYRRGIKQEEQSHIELKSRGKICEQSQDSKQTRPSTKVHPEKINVHRVQQKKQQLGSYKSKFQQNFVDISDYMSSVVKKKEQIRQDHLIKIASEHEFIPSTHINPNKMPQKIAVEDVVKNFCSQYDFLNMISYDDEYQWKLCKGKNQLKQKKGKAEKQLKGYKQKIKDEFLGQIDKYIDLYVDKTLQ